MAYLDYLGDRTTTPDLVDGFLAGLHEEGMRPTTIARKLAAVRGFHRFLVAENQAHDDPTRFTETPRTRMSFPKALDVREAIRLVEAPTTDTGLGRRDRALLETLYGTAVRVSELVGLDLTDLDLDTLSAMVTGKGGRQRLVLLGKPAARSIAVYLPDRIELCGSRRDHDALFVNARGGRLTRQASLESFAPMRRRWGYHVPASRPTCFAIRLPPTWWSEAPISVRCRKSSGTPACPPPRSTPGCHSSTSTRCTWKPIPEP